MVMMITLVRLIFPHRGDNIGVVYRKQMNVIAPSPLVRSCFIVWGDVDISCPSRNLRRKLNTRTTHMDYSIDEARKLVLSRGTRSFVNFEGVGLTSFIIF